MKLVLHIGTHKTGTTALQQFLDMNRRILITRGIHYATPPHGLQHSNLAANALNGGESRSVQAFFTKHTQMARRHGAHTLLASAENFYAMSVLLGIRRGRAETNTIERDRLLIETLPFLMPEGITTAQIVCYFRRPDRYAESLYSQQVKRGVGFDGTFGDFLPIIEPALSYNACMRLWSDTFGEKNCIVRVYEAINADIVSDFLPNVLNIDDIDSFALNHRKANERISRDLLEFKRTMNRHVRFSERDIERAILRRMDEEMDWRRAEPDCYQDFLSPYERAELLHRLRPEVAALQTSYDVPAFPPFDFDNAKANWRPYPGLDRRRRQEINFHYDRINRRLGCRVERFALRSAGFVRRRIPGTGVLLDVLKESGVKRALHRSLTGVQRGGR
jgi:hypothetical protein